MAIRASGHTLGLRRRYAGVMLDAISRSRRAALLVAAVYAAACAPALPPASAGRAAPPPSGAASASATATPTMTAVATSASAAPVAAPTILATPLAVPPSQAPAAPAPTAPPPAPTVAITPTVKAIPTIGTRGTTFVFQLASFPPNVEFALTVARPDGKTSPPTTWRIAENGTGLATFATNLADPTGPYLAMFKNGGVSAQVIFQLQ